MLQNFPAVIVLVRRQVKGRINTGCILTICKRAKLGLRILKRGGNGLGAALISWVLIETVMSIEGICHV